MEKSHACDKAARRSSTPARLRPTHLRAIALRKGTPRALIVYPFFAILESIPRVVKLRFDIQTPLAGHMPPMRRPPFSERQIFILHQLLVKLGTAAEPARPAA
jgi:hypothetical protein